MKTISFFSLYLYVINANHFWINHLGSNWEVIEITIPNKMKLSCGKSIIKELFLLLQTIFH